MCLQLNAAPGGGDNCSPAPPPAAPCDWMRRRLFSSAVGVGGRRGPAEGDAVLAELRGSAPLRVVDGGGMEPEGSGGGGSAGLMQQILSLKLVPRVGNGTLCPNSTSLCSFPGTTRPAPAHCAPVAGRPQGEAEAASEPPPGSLGATPLLS